MWALMMIALQTGAVAGPILPAPRKPPTARRCPPDDGNGDVVVCGRSSDAYRIGTIPDGPKPVTLPKARTEIAGVGTVSAEAEQVDVGGMPSKRAMIRLTIPMGGRRKP